MNKVQILVDLNGPMGMTATFPSSSSSLTDQLTVVNVTSIPTDAVSWQYSVDKGATWTTKDLSFNSFSLIKGEYNINDVQIRDTNRFYSFDNSTNGKILVLR